MAGEAGSPGRSAPRIAVVGAGAIGAAFAAVFADAGAEVAVVEPDAGRRDGLPAALARAHAAMTAAGLARREEPAAVGVGADLAAACAGAALVLECGPERLDAKQALFAAIGAAAPAEALIATASSALTISQIVPEPGARARCLVAHPLNPPTILRVLEIVPAPETDPAAVARAVALFTALGFAPAALGREIPGFVLNRLQGAVLRESYRMVQEGVISATDLDALFRDGLGPRWALSGPFETAELNTGGIAAHAARMGPAYRAMGEGRGETDAGWSDALVAEVERQRRAVLRAEDIPARAAWREAALARLIAARARVLADG